MDQMSGGMTNSIRFKVSVLEDTTQLLFFYPMNMQNAVSTYAIVCKTKASQKLYLSRIGI